jgi:DNA repair exonuclease SbcCD ATPase subunit
MQDFTIGDLGVFIGTIGGVITSILVIIQKSKCIKLDFLCCHCIRDINELKKEERNKKEKEDLNNTIDEQIEQLQQKIKEHKNLQEIHNDLQGKHEELQGEHEDLKEEHVKIQLLTNGSEEMKMEVIDTSTL